MKDESVDLITVPSAFSFTLTSLELIFPRAMANKAKMFRSEPRSTISGVEI